MTLNDVKNKSDSLQTDWMSATSLTLFSCLQTKLRLNALLPQFQRLNKIFGKGWLKQMQT